MRQAAAQHKGTSFIEILQNCVVFNEGVLDNLGDRSQRAENTVYLEHGKPLRFGEGGKRGIALRSMAPEVVAVGDGGAAEKDLYVHDVGCESAAPAYMLAGLEPPDFPKAFGIFRQIERPTYEDLMMEQIDAATARGGRGDLADLLGAGTTWDVD